ncbi:MAG: hypothetical protein JSS69_07110 [Acidobacteria bacterium]|nr:hypothetical protein [Acidobacteriota bacterium]MBS1865673.1 hypothetical protein [Acidobacteriota bacterium]
MFPHNPAPAEFRYDILIEDADGRDLRLESVRDLSTARERLPLLAAQYPGTRLLLRNRLTKVILAQSEDR